MKKNYIIEWLRENLSEERFTHSLGTAKMAVNLAKKYGADENKAEIAALLHDCAKCFPNVELLKIIKEKLPEISKCELLNHKTLHAPVGAHLAKEIFDIDDPEIIASIKNHTLGRVDMTEFEKIIFVADKIEENTRCKIFSGEILNIINNHEGKKGLDLALLRCFQETMQSLIERKLLICQTTINVYNDLIKRNCN